MNYQGLMEITKIENIADDVYEMTLKGEGAKYISQPGQFINIKINESLQPYLRRPMSISDYDENTIVPTTVSTIWYDNKISKEIFNDLRKIMKRYASTTINGYMILKNAYSKKEQLRFVTIGAQSPREYDLIV